MYKVSDAFAAAMANHPYSARITLDNGVVIQSNPADREDPINEITFRGGANGNNEGLALGGTVSASVEIVMNKEKINCEFAGRQITVELVLGNEALPMGVYYVTDPRADDDLLTVTACDALGTKFERGYESLDGFSFDVGVSSTGFLSALCERRGVEVDVSNLVDVSLKVSPDGFTERQIIGFIAALNGGFAVIDRNGVLRIRSYTQCEAKVTPDSYYEGGLEKADYTFSVQWIKCYNEATDLTMVMGDMAASQGVYLESIWMTNEILMTLWDKLQNFSYVPVMELSFLGNPLIDVGDIITLEDLSGATVMVPVMKITHEYDGGVLTRVEANGQAETSNSAGSVKSQINRATVRAKQYTDSENEKLNQLELLKRLTKEWVDDAIYITKDGKLAIKATAILTGILNANLLQTGRITSTDGKTVIDLSGGEVEFFDGIRTNGLIVQSEQTGNVHLFQVGAGQTETGTPYLSMRACNASGDTLLRMYEVFNPETYKSDGEELQLYNPENTLSLNLYAYNDAAGISLMNESTGTGREVVSIDTSGNIRVLGRKAKWEYNSTIGKYILVSD